MKWRLWWQLHHVNQLKFHNLHLQLTENSPSPFETIPKHNDCRHIAIVQTVVWYKQRISNTDWMKCIISWMTISNNVDCHKFGLTINNSTPIAEWLSSSSFFFKKSLLIIYMHRNRIAKRQSSSSLWLQQVTVLLCPATVIERWFVLVWVWCHLSNVFMSLLDLFEKIHFDTRFHVCARVSLSHVFMYTKVIRCYFFFFFCHLIGSRQCH